MPSQPTRGCWGPTVAVGHHGTTAKAGARARDTYEKHPADVDDAELGGLWVVVVLTPTAYARVVEGLEPCQAIVMIRAGYN